MTTVRVLDARALGAEAVVRALERPPAAIDPEVQRVVDAILADVRERGDQALVELTARFDKFAAASAEALRIGPDEFDLERDYISMDSLLGRALLGKSLDDELSITLPAGSKTYVIVEIAYGERPCGK